MSKIRMSKTGKHLYKFEEQRQVENNEKDMDTETMVFFKRK